MIFCQKISKIYDIALKVEHKFFGIFDRKNQINIFKVQSIIKLTDKTQMKDYHGLLIY